MGSLASVEYGSTEPEQCGKCGMTEKDGCCDTEHKFLKIDDAHVNAFFTKAVSPSPAILPVQEFTFVPSFSTSTLLASDINGPPDYKQPATFLLNCVFRI